MGHAWAKRCEHIPFGLVQIGGKKGSTKEGNVVLLKDVIEEAENRVKQLVGREPPHRSGVPELRRASGASSRLHDLRSVPRRADPREEGRGRVTATRIG